MIPDRAAASLVEKVESRKPRLGGERATEESDAQQPPVPVVESLLERGSTLTYADIRIRSDPDWEITRFSGISPS